MFKSRPLISLPSSLNLFIRQDPDNLFVFWNTNSPDFLLQWSSSLDTNAVWNSLFPPYAVSGSFYQYMEPNASLAPSRFFRLKSP